MCRSLRLRITLHEDNGEDEEEKHDNCDKSMHMMTDDPCSQFSEDLLSPRKYPEILENPTYPAFMTIAVAALTTRWHWMPYCSIASRRMQPPKQNAYNCKCNSWLL